MTIQQLTQTDSFTIEYDDASPSAQRRAVALASSVERDAATLYGWFGVADPLHPGNRCTVRVTTDTPLGTNWGYQSASHGTLVEISPLEGESDQAVADDLARGVFVSEFAEVLMDVQQRRRAPHLESPRQRRRGAVGDLLRAALPGCGPAHEPAPSWRRVARDG